MYIFSILNDFLDRIPTKSANPFDLWKYCLIHPEFHSQINMIPYLSRSGRIAKLNQYLVRAAIHHDFCFLQYARKNGCDMSKVLYYLLSWMNMEVLNSKYEVSVFVMKIKELYNVEHFHDLQVMEDGWNGSIIEWICLRKCHTGFLHNLLLLSHLNINSMINESHDNILILLVKLIMDKNYPKRKLMLIIKYIIVHSDIDLEHRNKHGESFLQLWKSYIFLKNTNPYDFYHIKNLYTDKLNTLNRKKYIRSLLLIFKRKPFLCEDLCKEILSFICLQV